MPARGRFVDAPHYYSTMFHELIHSTGHESRPNRTFRDRFGDELYSKEKLGAEMGAAFLLPWRELPTSTPTATQSRTSRTGLLGWKRITDLSTSGRLHPREHLRGRDRDNERRRDATSSGVRSAPALQPGIGQEERLLRD
jgi:hypothetical protein